MTKPIIMIHNVETNKITKREMTDTEFAQYEADQAVTILEKTEAEAKATAKAALLAQLGITEEQAKLLLS
jgi:lipoate synthase